MVTRNTSNGLRNSLVGIRRVLIPYLASLSADRENEVRVRAAPHGHAAEQLLQLSCQRLRKTRLTNVCLRDELGVVLLQDGAAGGLAESLAPSPLVGEATGDDVGSVVVLNLEP